MNPTTRVLLTGMSGTGKSTVAALVAERLGWNVIEMDHELEQAAGMTIPEIFRVEGEAGFRAREAALFETCVQSERTVVSTGGGAVCNDRARDLMRADNETLTVWLTASPETLDRRIRAHSEDAPAGLTVERPMLAGDDPVARLRDLIAQRTKWYEDGSIALSVEDRTAEEVASDVAELVRLRRGESSIVTLRETSSESDVFVGRGGRDRIATLLTDTWPRARSVWIGIDEHVADAHAEWLDRLRDELGEGHRVSIQHIPSGEGSKSLDMLSDLYDWMLDGGVQRGDVAIAVGGGVVGDLMGFAAATVLRGIGLMQVPTTLLAMVDSSVGGKTGINHAAGKNLIGAFKQPRLVVVDPSFLDSLPEREFRSGFAEMVKHGVIEATTPGGHRSFLLEATMANANALVDKQGPVLDWLIRKNIALKAAVVEADEREADLRQILNFGHTIGHGIEAAGYRLLHGEAVGLGMLAVMAIAVDRGMIGAGRRDEMVSTLANLGLPTSAELGPDAVIVRMESDKKKQAGKQQWVMPIAEGGVEIVTGIGADEVRRAIASVQAS